MPERNLLTFFQIVKRLYGPYRWQIFALAAFGFLSGILESLGVSMIIPLFSHVSNQPLLESNQITKFFDAFFTFLNIEPRLRFLIPLIVIFFLLRACALYAFEFLRMRLTVNYERNSRINLYEEFLKTRWFYLLKQKLGHLENTLMADIGAATNFLSHLTNAILNLASLLVYIAVALSLSAHMTMLTLLGGAVLLFVFRPFIAKTRLYSQTGMVLNKRLAHDINENIIGSKTIKALGAESAIAKSIAKLFDELRAIKIKQAMVKSFTNSAIEPVSLIMIVAIFTFSFLRPGFNFAVFAVLLYMIQRIFIYVDRAQVSLHGISSGLPHAERALLLKEELEREKETEAGSAPFRFQKQLQFQSVGFNYAAPTPVLKDVNFILTKGEMLGIVGSSGAGKTTIADLILRFFEPTRGKILVDGIDAKNISLRDWRKKVGYVAQDVFLLNDTIENNVRFYSKGVLEESFSEALRFAHVLDFAVNFPEELKTVVGERGLHLSVGQRQRVALARILARRPEILILDEATSALDNESEALIRESIESLKGRLTLLIVAHRLSTIMNCNRVLVLKSGQIVEDGAPRALLNDPKTYFYRLYNAN